MRLAMIAALAVAAVAGCSAAELCGPSTCVDGCCSADGECLAGTETAACGAGGNWCQECEAGACVSQICRTSTVGGHDGGVTDAGFDAGPEDAGALVSVRLTYERYVVTTCPVKWDRVVCDETKTVAESRIQKLQQDYAGCAQSVDGGIYLFDCDNCQGFTDLDCTLPDGGIDHGSVPTCDYPPLTVADFCAWQIP